MRRLVEPTGFETLYGYSLPMVLIMFTFAFPVWVCLARTAVAIVGKSSLSHSEGQVSWLYRGAYRRSGKQCFVTET